MDHVTPLHVADRAVDDAVAEGTAPFGLPAALVRNRGTLKIYFYKPREKDHQSPHEQDEVYVVISGSGVFATGPSEDRLTRSQFGPGDAIFTPAGSVHRFEDFSDNFATWVIMYGQDGGEAALSDTIHPSH